MTEKDEFALNIDSDSVSENKDPQYCLRDGVIFLIDTTDPMFEIDPDAGTSYFSQSLEAYKNILSEKLSWNKTDWMGIILMGTNKWDQDPENKHVLTWQAFEEVSIDQMTKIEDTLKDVEKFHREIGSSTKYPLYDALWYATRCFNAVKVKMPFRDIILLTRSDNPSKNDPKEQHRIRLKAADCVSLHIRLSIVGFGKQWNPQHFFKELEVQSGKFDRVEDYRRTILADFEEEVKHASRITAKLQWTLDADVKLGVSISTITAKTQFPKKIRLNKKNNEPLEGYSYFTEVEAYSEDEEDEDEDGEADSSKIALPKNVFYYQQFGGRDIKFSKSEAVKLKNFREPGINLLGFKPQSRLDVSLHLEAPRFVTYDESELEGSKTLFAALLKRCEARNVMAICVVTLRGRSASYLYTMIPSTTKGGFYAYKLPFTENVRDFDSVIPEYVYDETDNMCPINEDTVDLCYEFIKKSSFAYAPNMFLNPKLHVELANIESLAMDKDSSEVPIDSTIPDKEAVCERLGELKERFEEVVCIHDKDKCVKRPRASSSDSSNKVRKIDEVLNFEQLVRERKVENCTIKQLKDYLKSVGSSSAGTKMHLVSMVYDLVNKT